MKKFITALIFALPFTAFSAHALQSGVEYQDVTPTQLTTVNKGQIEVMEFFWYGCPHCFNLEPVFASWAKKVPANVVVKRVPAILNEGWEILARAYYAMEAIGVLDKLHVQLFEAIHVKGMRFSTPTAFFDWAATKGVDRHKLAEAYDSFSVNSEVLHAKQMTKAFKLNGVPSIVVNGKYLTSASQAGNETKLFTVVNELIAREQTGVAPRNATEPKKSRHKH